MQHFDQVTLVVSHDSSVEYMNESIAEFRHGLTNRLLLNFVSKRKT